MKVNIYQPSKTAMQSGRAKTGQWVVEYDLPTARVPEPLMGWTASGDTLNQVKLEFPTADEAISFAQKKGWTYVVLPPHGRKIKPRSYSDNFRYIPPADRV